MAAEEMQTTLWRSILVQNLSYYRQKNACSDQLQAFPKRQRVRSLPSKSTFCLTCRSCGTSEASQIITRLKENASMDLHAIADERDCSHSQFTPRSGEAHGQSSFHLGGDGRAGHGLCR